MAAIKMYFYGIAVACFAAASVLDFCGAEYKLGTTAALFAVANAVIFFWR